MRRGPLRERSFALLFAGQAVSAIGNRIVPVALSFAVLDLTGSVSDLGVVLAAQTLPLLAFVLLGGVWADRLPRQLVMLVSDGVRALAQGLTAALLLTGSAHLWELVVLQALYGAAVGFFGPAATALVPQTVAEGELQQANALLGLSSNAADVLGPALAGVLVVAAGPGWGLAGDAVTFAASAVLLGLMRVRPVATPGARRSTFAELRAGWQAFRSRTWLWTTVAFFTLYVALVYSPLIVLGPQVALRSLGGAGAWAAMGTTLGVGSIAGGLVGLRWRPRHPLRFTLCLFLFSGPVLFALLAAHAPLPAILVVCLADGVAGTLFNVYWFTALQRDVPAAEQSRVSSWDYLGSLALQPVGLAISGPVAAAVGLSTTLYGAGALFLVLLAAVLAVPAVRNFSLDNETAAGRR
jgi:MFS family permease